jgi:predicted TIM-barrel fold metal-dependent hydrolase
MIIDFCGHFGSDSGLPDCHDPSNLLRLAKASGIDLTVASNLGSTFGELPDGLIQFPSISPTSDLDELASDPSIKGIRIYPTYQPWDFDGAEAAKLLSLAKDRDLIVQICLRLQDPRVLPQTVPSAAVLASLDNLAESHPSVRFVVSGANYGETKANPALFARANVWTDISHLQHPINSLPKLLDIVDRSRVLFGSNSPIFYPYMAVFRVIHSPISDEDRDRILFQNARQLLDGGVQ